MVKELFTIGMLIAEIKQRQVKIEEIEIV